MNKAQLIDAIAEKAGLTKADSKKALEAFVETVGEALKGGDKVLEAVETHRLAKLLLFRLRKLLNSKQALNWQKNSDQEIKIKEGVFRKSTPSFVWDCIWKNRK